MARTYCAAPDNELDGRRTCLCRLPFLLMFVTIVFFPLHSGDGTRKLPSGKKEDGVTQGVGQHRFHCLSKRKDPRRVFETSSSTRDFERDSTVSFHSREIDAI